jgi:hypothetical protein
MARSPSIGHLKSIGLIGWATQKSAPRAPVLVQ